MEQVKRKRGGQPGNSNALKSGVYSRALSTMKKRQLRQAAGLEEIDRYARLAKLKLDIFLQAEPTLADPVLRAFTVMVYLDVYRRKLERHYQSCTRILNAAAVLSNLDLMADPPAPASDQ